MVSILAPCHNEANVIPIFVEAVQNAALELKTDWELVLIDDGSTDNTSLIVKEVQKKDPHLKYFQLSKNIGQYEAIGEGIQYCQGEWIVVMDADGQDEPKMIPFLYKKAFQGGFDAVFAERFHKKYSPVKVITSKLFHSTLQLLTGCKQNHRIAGFGIYKKEVLEELSSKNNSLLYLPLMRQWLPYQITTLDVEHQARVHGRSSYSFHKQMALAFKIFKSLNQN
jgi:glycosyltransferase involved in cell wall biosynthesis